MSEPVTLKLYPKQALALNSPAQLICYGGARGGGKSYLIRAASIIYAIEVPGISIYVFRKNYNDLMANHVHTSNHGYMQMLQPMMDQKLVSYNKSEYAFVFANGSRIQLAHLNNDSDLLSYQGREAQVLFLDESTQFTPVAIMTLISCMRLGSLPVPDKWRGKIPRCILTTNPGGVSHQFHKERFVDFGTEIHQHPPEWGNMVALFIPAFITDNKVLMENDPTYKDRLLGLSVDSPETARAMIEGDWNISASNAITHWKREIHVIPPFSIPKTWDLFPCYDWGYSAPAACLWLAVSNGEDYVDGNGEIQSADKDSIFIVAEAFFGTPEGKGLKLEPSQMAQRIREISESFEALGLKVKNGPADNAIFSKDRGKSIAQLFSENGVQWLRSNKNPGSRVLGLQIINQMVYNATLAVPEGPILKSFSTNGFFNVHFQALQRDKMKPEDVDTKGNEHSYDALRYGVLHVHQKVIHKPVLGL